MICWRYLHGEGFAASQLAITLGFWNFLALTYIWISALEGAPPPCQPLTEPQAWLPLPRCSQRNSEPKTWAVPSHTYKIRVQSSPKSARVPTPLLLMSSKRGVEHPPSLSLHAACGGICGPPNLVSIHGAPPGAQTQWIGCRPVTSNSLCRSCAVPPDWPICSAGKFPWCAGQSSFESNHKAIGSLVIVHPCSFT